MASSADELPAKEYPDTPGWCENYWFVGYDPQAEIGLWSHMGRQVFDPTLWREISVLYLPTGERLLTKGYGRGESDSGPGGPSLTYACVEPWKRWQTRLDGVARRVTESALEQGVAGDGVHEPVSYELDWQPVSEPWQMGEEMQGQSWGEVHYQQAMQVSGTIRHGGEEISFAGNGVRDHTRGPRDFEAIERHVAAHGVFPGGRAFIFIDVEGVESRISRAALVEDGELREAEVSETPFLSSHADGSTPYAFHLGDVTIEAEILHNMPYGFAGQNETVLGWDPDVASHSLFEGWTRFTWEGETGYGLTERSVRDRRPGA